MFAATESDMVRCILVDSPVNAERDSVIWTFNSREYLLKKGKPTFVPVMAAILYCGDPRSGSNITTIREPGGQATGWIPDRKTEVARLRLLHGAVDNSYPRFDDLAIPEVEIYSLDDERVLTVLDDPTGDHIETAISTVNEKEAMMEMIANQQRQLDRLTASLGGQDEVDAEGDLPSDEGSAKIMTGV